MPTTLANKHLQLTNNSVVLDVKPPFAGDISLSVEDRSLTGDGGFCLELLISVVSKRSRKGLRVGSPPHKALFAGNAGL